MQDTKLMTNDELAQELDAFYNFVGIVGHQYFTSEGNRRFNQLRGEYCVRVQEGQIQPQQQTMIKHPCTQCEVNKSLYQISLCLDCLRLQQATA